MRNRARISFPNLDALRFLAFASVFVGHGFGDHSALDDHSIITLLTRVLVLSAGLGVSFFFVLSGFLITYLILTEIRFTGSG
jgi:peptidoglycan/LPS O-acetylase OafA/YrhL